MHAVVSNRSHAWARVVVAAALILLAGIAAGQSRPAERILSYDVVVTIAPDSTMDVEETIRVVARGDEIRHGILRDFPTEYHDANGQLYDVGFHVVRVLRDGKPEPYSVSSFSNGKRVRIGSRDTILERGEYTYVIDYKTDHQLGFFADHDELYWNVTGFWPFAIDHATARVHLPQGVPTENLRLAAYTGARGAKGTDFTAEVVDGIPTFATTAPFDPYEGLTIVVGWPKGFVTPPPPVRRRIPRSFSWHDLATGDWWKIRIFRDAGGTAMATVAVALFFLLLITWMQVGRDPSGRSVTVVYEPPEHLSPAAMRCARTLKFDAKAMTAAVLDLAAKKYLTVEKDGHTYVLARTGKEADPPPSQDEDLIAQALFTSDDTIKQARDKFEAQLPELKKNHPVLARLAEGLADMFEPDDPNRVRLRRSSPRLMSAFQAAKDHLTREYSPKSLMRPHAGVNSLAFLFAGAGTFACLRLYPGWLSFEDGSMPGAIFFMVFYMIGMLWFGGRLATFLPIESFAPARTTGDRIGNGIGLVLSTAFALATGWLVALATSLEWAIAFGGMWLTISFFSRLIKQPTELGQQYWDATEGFRQFLAEVDEDRLNRMNPPAKTPQLFERMLPYALALDCEVVWAKKFESVLAMAATAQPGGEPTYSPSWYSGGGGMINAGAFTNAFSSSFTSAIASSTTPPGSSSGFSGGGGGGSSGGGGGGGGGGGW